MASNNKGLHGSVKSMSRFDKGRERSVLLPVCLEKRKWMVKCRSRSARGSGEGLGCARRTRAFMDFIRATK